MSERSTSELSACRPAAGAAHVLVDAPGDLAHELGRLRRGHPLGQRRRGHLQRGQLIDEPLDALGLGALVHAVQARHPALREQAGDGLVGRDHQVLDQAVGLGLHATEDVRDVAVLVERELGLLGVEHQRPAALALPRQRRRRLARGAQRRPHGSAADSLPAKMRSTRS